MSVNGIGATILWTGQLEKVIDFYKTLGLQLEEEKHEEGPLHYACNFGQTHFAIYEGSNENARKRSEGGAIQIAFLVDDVDSVFSKLKEFGSEVVWEPDDASWGRTALVYDPDGRPVEFYSPKDS